MVRQLTTLMGGHVEVESEVQKGSVFKVLVPCQSNVDLTSSPDITEEKISIPKELVSDTDEKVELDIQGQGERLPSIEAILKS